MKRTERLLSLLLVLVLCLFAVCACKETPAEPVTTLSKTAKEISDAVRAGADFSGAAFVAHDETDADLVLMFNYAIDSDEMIGAIEDYVLSTQIDPDYPKFFSIVRVKEGTDPAVITAIADAMKAGYVQYNIDQMVQYNTDGLATAQAFTVKTYDNGVIAVAYSENGNDEIITLAEDACRAK